jgi:hypothetical protein
MGIKRKSLASAIALGFALLAFGPAASTAQADSFGRHGSFQGRHSFAHRGFAPIRRHAFGRPFHGFGPRVGFGFGFARPYRLVRVFVYDPFPRWIYRRVYYDAPYAGAYCGY